MSKMKYLGALGLLLGACGGQAAGDGGAQPNQVALKKAAAESVANGTATSDPCTANGWYGDQVCDTFCKDKDTDCIPKDRTSTVCAEFEEAPNGLCSRKPNDPCIFQDPDCNTDMPPSTGPTTPIQGPVVCAAISETPDGTCKRPTTDPCRWQDPDCENVISCPDIAGVSDGVCSLPVSDPCRGIDPDCVSIVQPPPIPPDTGSGGDSGGSNPGSGVVCAQYVMAPDGVCSLPADDPCLFHDPDCKGDGSTPGGGIACAEFIMNPDGVCSLPPDDPCLFQDPDCKPSK
jgi:hypothetical protein